MLDALAYACGDRESRGNLAASLAAIIAGLMTRKKDPGSRMM